MQQTANYQLNQWDGEDRIMRVDFNSDNAKIDAALQQNATALSQSTASLEAALETERQARASGDDAASQATASARQELLNAISAEQTARADGDSAANQATASARQELLNSIATEQTARANGDSAVRNEFAAADAAIRRDFAAADAAVSTAFPLVKLQDIVTSQPASQIDLDFRNIDFRNMACVILIPQVNSSTDQAYLRINSISQGGYYLEDGSSKNYLTSFLCNQLSDGNIGYAYCSFFLYRDLIACLTHYIFYWRSSFNGYDHRSLMPARLTPSSALQTVNVLTNDGSVVEAGSRFTLYGIKF